MVECLAMPTTTMTEPATTRPDYFRLPKPGCGDPYFNFSRSFYYNGELRGWWKLVHLREQGKKRGVTLIPYRQIEAFVRSLEEERAE